MKCQGRPEDGICPENRNDSTVHNTIADLFLCYSCDEYRWPSLKSANTSNNKLSGKPSKKSATKPVNKNGKPKKENPACKSVVINNASPKTYQKLKTTAKECQLILNLTIACLDPMDGGVKRDIPRRVLRTIQRCFRCVT